MSTPAAKRRRLDAANQALSKPFRSPFKTPYKSPAKDKEASGSILSESSTAPEVPLSTTTSSPNNAHTQAVQPSLPLKSKPTNSLLNTPSLSAPKFRTRKTFSSPVATAAVNADPEVAELIRKQRDLERELRELKEGIEQAEQAGKIERESVKKGEDTVDQELVVLCGKWKAASRQAAEELFGKVRDRVNRMGGPRAWKEMQKKQQEWQESYNQEEEVNKGSDDDDDANPDVEKRDLYAEYDIDPETQNEKLQRPNGVGDTGELPGQEDEFTMAMMLRTLNVDLDIIGYDREQQIWVD